MKLSSYCFHDLKIIIFYRGPAQLLFTSYGPLSSLSFRRHNLVSATLLQLSRDFDETFQFVCVEVLRPSQPNRVLSSAVSLPSYMFTGQA